MNAKKMLVLNLLEKKHQPYGLFLKEEQIPLGLQSKLGISNVTHPSSADVFLLLQPLLPQAFKYSSPQQPSKTKHGFLI